MISISYCLDVMFESGRTRGLEGTCFIGISCLNRCKFKYGKREVARRGSIQTTNPKVMLEMARCGWSGGGLLKLGPSVHVWLFSVTKRAMFIWKQNQYESKIWWVLHSFHPTSGVGQIPMFLHFWTNRFFPGAASPPSQPTRTGKGMGGDEPPEQPAWLIRLWRERWQDGKPGKSQRRGPNQDARELAKYWKLMDTSRHLQEELDSSVANCKTQAAQAWDSWASWE